MFRYHFTLITMHAFFFVLKELLGRYLWVYNIAILPKYHKPFLYTYLRVPLLYLIETLNLMLDFLIKCS